MCNVSDDHKNSDPSYFLACIGNFCRHISESHLTGTLPTELGSLRSLTTLYLYNNFLSGTIPSEMGCMPNLTIISLHTNKVGGPLPSELANLKKLKHM
mmetsp:Transcript_43459/g.81396  ORF Transcript_43459/g.81396 Transcript_43459/m.81396 type:complete len:98 (+) Transcript_43459:172-465(+)